MIVETCMKFNGPSTAIVLLTYREPIVRFVSWVNWLCNRQLKKRTEETLSFCRRCEYDSETKPFLQTHVDEFNDMYLSASYITQSNFTNVQVLSLETIYLNKFLEFASTQPDFEVASLGRNLGKTDKCNFGVTADIIRELEPSVGVYRNLLIGAFLH